MKEHIKIPVTPGSRKVLCVFLLIHFHGFLFCYKLFWMKGDRILNNSFVDVVAQSGEFLLNHFYNTDKNEYI